MNSLDLSRVLHLAFRLQLATCRSFLNLTQLKSFWVQNFVSRENPKHFKPFMNKIVRANGHIWFIPYKSNRVDVFSTLLTTRLYIILSILGKSNLLEYSTSTAELIPKGCIRLWKMEPYYIVLLMEESDNPDFNSVKNDCLTRQQLLKKL